MGREIFIVSRDRDDLYRYLRTTFAGVPTVEIIWDRRAGERRIGSQDPAAERRRADRRVHHSVEEDLKKVGYAFLAID